MKKFMLYFLVAVLLALDPTGAFGASKAIEKQHAEMLYPVVQVVSGQGVGSGTVIFSTKVDGNFETYVLTNHHVIAGAISVEEKYDYEAKKSYKIEKKQTVKVNWFNYNDLSRFVGTTGRVADIVAYSKAHDLALLKIRDSETGVDHVATIYPPCAPLALFETTYAVGGGLGRPPFATKGILGFLDMENSGTRYLMATSPIIFGNSGGALFHFNEETDKYELIGVPAAVSVIGSFFSQTPVTHMGWAISIESVEDFLEDNAFSYLIPACDIDDVIEGLDK